MAARAPQDKQTPWRRCGETVLLLAAARTIRRAMARFLTLENFGASPRDFFARCPVDLPLMDFPYLFYGL
jgi:hypothetical protein